MAYSFSFEWDCLLSSLDSDLEESYYSEHFIDNYKNEFKLHLIKGDYNISLYITLLTRVNIPSGGIILAFSILDKKRTEMCQLGPKFVEFSYGHQSWGFSDIFRTWDIQEDLLGLDGDSVLLTVVCTIQFHDEKNDFLGRHNKCGYYNLLDTKFCSDVTLHSTDGEIFAAHKAILGAQSSFFQEIFDEDPKIKTFEVKDISTVSLASMIYFVYTSSLTPSGKPFFIDTQAWECPSIRELLSCAEKYRVAALINYCCEILEDGIQASDAAEILMLTDRYKCHVREEVISYIKWNFAVVKKTDGWKQHIASNPALMDVLFSSLVMPLALPPQLEAKDDDLPDIDYHSLFTGHRYGNTYSFEHSFSLRKLTKKGRYLSDLFEDLENGRVWRLVLLRSSYPFVSIYLQLCPYSTAEASKDVVVDCTFLILDAQRNKLCRLESRHKYSQQRVLGYKDVLQLKKHDLVNVFCEIKDPARIPRCDEIFFENFNNLLRTGIHSDVTLCVDNTELKAHKAILGTRSPVFRAMFEHEMQENIVSKVEISDASVSCVEAFLNYIYGNVEPKHTDAHITELLIMAEKYQVKDLKNVCEKELCKHTTELNACERLILGDMYQAFVLKEGATKFIIRNFPAVRETEGWTQFVQEHTILFDQLLSHCASPVSEL